MRIMEGFSLIIFFEIQIQVKCFEVEPTNHVCCSHFVFRKMKLCLASNVVIGKVMSLVEQLGRT